jgi:hypothetical protein
MRLQELTSLYFSTAHQVLDLTGEDIDVQAELRLSPDVHRRASIDEAAGVDLGPGSIVLALLGPDRMGPEALALVVRKLQTGARAVLLAGWPIEQVPYHRLLGPLSAARCQVLEAVPLDRVSVGAPVHCAIVVERVARLAPPRAYLTDIGTEPDSFRDDGADELASVLRAVNECVLVDFVTRPVRRKIFEAPTAAELRRRLDQREARLKLVETRLAQTETRLAQAERRLAAIQSSAAFQVGQAMVHELRHPARAVVTIPRDLARVWRDRRSRGPA